MEYLGEAVLLRKDGKVCWLFDAMSPDVRKDIGPILDEMDSFIDEFNGYRITLKVEKIE